MDFDDVSFLRANSPAWRLLRADSSPLVLWFLGDVFVQQNSPAAPGSDLVARLDDVLHAVNSPEVRFPRAARDYLDVWAAPEQGWLRKFYPAGSNEPHFDATPALEKAYAWVTSLQTRSFVGTESRLHTLVELLRQMVYGAETDPAVRLMELRRRRDELDAEIADAERGQVTRMGGAALRDRYQMFSATARELLSDFREVADNFRALDRAARERIASWTGSKGELLEELLGDRTSIAASDQGRSFQAFYDFLLSRRRQDELADLLDAVQQLDEVTVDGRMRHIHYDWMDAAERTQQTVRQLSEQLRRFLDDQVWLENRRVMELLRSIESRALAVRSELRPRLTMQMDATSPRISLPMERPLYAVRPRASLDSTIVEGQESVDTTALFEQVYVDQARLADNVRSAVRRHGQVLLADVLREHPPERGLAEIIGYLALAEDDLAVVVDESSRTRIAYVDPAGHERILQMPQVTLSRRTRRTERAAT